MGEEVLVDDQIVGAMKLVTALDEKGEPPSFAVWYYFSDADEWRLLLAGPNLNSLLPKDESRAYQKVSEVLQAEAIDPPTLADIRLVKTDYTLLQVVARLIHTAREGLVRAHFKDNMVNGVFIKDMVVIRSS